ncbi:hypothetical protein [Modestobacter italicus]|uniref:hypothetical protein n=1 Tax=Modestobacter italicus (strain DSM 44449 / CECT 9708 / BC 501) TaxID=2732864 RepID=UPI0014133013|nr:hypothetical protein [Modestobacter marinus]
MPGVYLASGDLSVLGTHVVPLTFDPGAAKSKAADVAAMAVGGASLAAQVAHGINSARGLVRLSPETMAALKAGAKPFTKDGWNLGTLKDGNQFAHSVRWAPAGAQGATSVAASAGPAAAIMAIQMQLAEISALVEENIALTRSLLQAVEDERWASAKSHFDAIAEEFGHANALGEVTPSIWGQAQAQASETKLRELLELSLRAARRHHEELTALETSPARRTWLDTNARSVTQEAQTLLMAHSAWLRYQALRAGYLHRTAAEDPQDAALLERVIAGAQRRDAEVRAVAFPLLEDVYRLLRMLEEGTGSAWKKLFPGVRNREAVRAAAGYVATQLGALAGHHGAYQADPPPAPVEFTLLPLNPLKAVTSRLRWILREGETLVAVTKSGGWRELERYLVFTSSRILIVREGNFLSDGDVDQELPWTSVRTVAKVPDSDRDDGFDLRIQHGPVEKPDVRTFALRDSSLTHRGDAFVKRLTALVGEETGIGSISSPDAAVATVRTD